MNGKKLFSLILAMMMLLTLVPASAFAEDYELFSEEFGQEEYWEDAQFFEDEFVLEQEPVYEDFFYEEEPVYEDFFYEEEPVCEENLIEAVYENELTSETQEIIDEGDHSFTEDEEPDELEEDEIISEFELSDMETYDAAGSIVITKQPESQTARENTTLYFTVEAAGNDLTYLWYYREAGTSDWISTGSVGRTDTLKLKLTAARNGRQMRCLIRDAEGGRVFTNTVTATIATEIEITEQPEDVSAAENTTVTFSVKANGDGLSYLWYYSDDNGASWNKTTGTAAEYSWKLTTARNGRQLKCLITDASGTEKYTEVATATIVTEIEITEQPEDVSAAENTTVTFSVKANGDGLSYLWYYSDDNGASWKKTTGTAAEYSWKLTAARNGRQLKCLITDASGTEMYTEVATATIENPAIVINGVTYEAVEGGCKIVSYSGTASVLEIPEVVEGMNVVEVGEEAFMGNTVLTSIDLPDTITVIRARAFKGCTNLSQMN